MKGVILFADNNVFENGCFENSLFEKFRDDSDYVVLPINSLDALEETLKNMSTFKALILDWNFSRDEGLEDIPGISLPPMTPENLLSEISLYSLVYVYSQGTISDAIQSKLKNKLGEKIYFKTKGRPEEIDNDVISIKEDIAKFESSNKHMEIPLAWSQAINKSVQEIFIELEQADPNWIREIRDTAVEDGGDPTSEVIDMFHHLLNELLIQNKSLRGLLNVYEPQDDVSAEENTAKLYRRILYSKIYPDAPIMTGDIFKFSDDEYGIVITPECEIGTKKDICLEFLLFKENDMNDFLKKNNSYERGVNSFNGMKDKSKNNLKKVFNNEMLSSHILPSFPFCEEICNKSASIDFKTAFSIRSKNDYENKRTGYKLNSPYIHQLRQRYVSFFGKYGVPAIPNTLREYNLK